jgi:ABC-type molybdate transport system substrate-binding protein
MYKRKSKKGYNKETWSRKFNITGNLILCAFSALIALLPFYATAASPNEITVSAAASLKNSFEEIAALFERTKNVKVHLNFYIQEILCVR